MSFNGKKKMSSQSFNGTLRGTYSASVCHAGDDSIDSVRITSDGAFSGSGR